jgi:DNA mismatch repair ATPase MutS
MGMEVIKIAEITKAMTPRSLILLNEPMTSTSAAEGIEICTDLLIELISKRVSSMMVTHFTDIYELLVTRLEAAGLSQRLKSYIMTTSQGSDNTISYLYKLKEAPPQRSSHARAVVGKLGVTLDSMLERLDSLGLDIRPQDTAWKSLERRC